MAGSLQGLQKMKSGVVEVDELFAALAPHVGRSQGNYCSHSFHAFFFSFSLLLAISFSVTLSLSLPPISHIFETISFSSSASSFFSSFLLCPIHPLCLGIFNSKGLSMSLNGLQGLDSKQADARSLINNLAILVEKSEVSCVKGKSRE